MTQTTPFAPVLGSQWELPVNLPRSAQRWQFQKSPEALNGVSRSQNGAQSRALEHRGRLRVCRMECWL
jgi:hypothetical protein